MPENDHVKDGGGLSQDTGSSWVEVVDALRTLYIVDISDMYFYFDDWSNAISPLHSDEINLQSM